MVALWCDGRMMVQFRIMMPHMGIMALWCDGRIMRNPELSTGMRVTRASEHPWKESLGPEERRVVADAARARGSRQDADSQCYKHEGTMDERMLGNASKHEGMTRGC